MYRTKMEVINVELCRILLFTRVTIAVINVISTQNGALLEEAEAWTVKSSRT